MPGIYRKKKRNPGPSKNEEKVERARQAKSQVAFGARYSQARSLTVVLTFSGPQGQSFGQETRTFSPQDPCDFAVPCPGRCGVGSFDLEGKIDAVIAAQEQQSQASGVCQEVLFAGSADTCGCKLDCAITVAYR